MRPTLAPGPTLAWLGPVAPATTACSGPANFLAIFQWSFWCPGSWQESLMTLSTCCLCGKNAEKNNHTREATKPALISCIIAAMALVSKVPGVCHRIWIYICCTQLFGVGERQNMIIINPYIQYHPMLLRFSRWIIHWFWMNALWRRPTLPQPSCCDLSGVAPTQAGASTPSSSSSSSTGAAWTTVGFKGEIKTAVGIGFKNTLYFMNSHDMYIVSVHCIYRFFDSMICTHHQNKSTWKDLKFQYDLQHFSKIDFMILNLKTCPLSIHEQREHEMHLVEQLFGLLGAFGQVSKTLGFTEHKYDIQYIYNII